MDELIALARNEDVDSVVRRKEILAEIDQVLSQMIAKEGSDIFQPFAAEELMLGDILSGKDVFGSDLEISVRQVVVDPRSEKPILDMEDNDVREMGLDAKRLPKEKFLAAWAEWKKSALLKVNANLPQNDNDNASPVKTLATTDWQLITSYDDAINFLRNSDGFVGGDSDITDWFFPGGTEKIAIQYKNPLEEKTFVLFWFDLAEGEHRYQLRLKLSEDGRQGLELLDQANPHSDGSRILDLSPYLESFRAAVREEGVAEFQIRLKSDLPQHWIETLGAAGVTLGESQPLMNMRMTANTPLLPLKHRIFISLGGADGQNSLFQRGLATQLEGTLIIANDSAREVLLDKFYKAISRLQEVFAEARQEAEDPDKWYKDMEIDLNASRNGDFSKLKGFDDDARQMMFWFLQGLGFSEKDRDKKNYWTVTTLNDSNYSGFANRLYEAFRQASAMLENKEGAVPLAAISPLIDFFKPYSVWEKKYKLWQPAWAELTQLVLGLQAVDRSPERLFFWPDIVAQNGLDQAGKGIESSVVLETNWIESMRALMARHAEWNNDGQLKGKYYTPSSWSSRRFERQISEPYAVSLTDPSKHQKAKAEFKLPDMEVEIQEDLTEPVLKQVSYTQWQIPVKDVKAVEFSGLGKVDSDRMEQYVLRLWLPAERFDTYAQILTTPSYEPSGKDIPKTVKVDPTEKTIELRAHDERHPNKRDRVVLVFGEAGEEVSTTEASADPSFGGKKEKDTKVDTLEGSNVQGDISTAALSALKLAEGLNVTALVQDFIEHTGYQPEDWASFNTTQPFEMTADYKPASEEAEESVAVMTPVDREKSASVSLLKGRWRKDGGERILTISGNIGLHPPEMDTRITVDGQVLKLELVYTRKLDTWGGETEQVAFDLGTPYQLEAVIVNHWPERGSIAERETHLYFKAGADDAIRGIEKLIADVNPQGVDIQSDRWTFQFESSRFVIHLSENQIEPGSFEPGSDTGAQIPSGNTKLDSQVVLSDVSPDANAPVAALIATDVEKVRLFEAELKTLLPKLKAIFEVRKFPELAQAEEKQLAKRVVATVDAIRNLVGRDGFEWHKNLKDIKADDILFFPDGTMPMDTARNVLYWALSTNVDPAAMDLSAYDFKETKRLGHRPGSDGEFWHPFGVLSFDRAKRALQEKAEKLEQKKKRDEAVLAITGNIGQAVRRSLEERPTEWDAERVNFGGSSTYFKF
nr:hypothetical protein [Candidatus Omnitrophota bacterium]